jgi:hypothetical protein
LPADKEQVEQIYDICSHLAGALKLLDSAFEAR